jgi:hypothetical protein
MVRKWVLGVGLAVAVVAVAGTGFAAFTANVTVNGQATAGSMGLAIVNTAVAGCSSFYGAQYPGPGNVTFSNLNEQRTAVTLTISNLTPSAYCGAWVELENTGSVPVTLGLVMNTAGENGVCPTVSTATNCYSITTLSGIDEGQTYWDGSPYGLTPTTSISDITTLNPGGTYTDLIGAEIPSGSTNATPGTVTFTLVYTGSAGY